MEFGEMKRNTSNWSNFCMFLRRAGLTASAGLSCFYYMLVLKLCCMSFPVSMMCILSNSTYHFPAVLCPISDVMIIRRSSRLGTCHAAYEYSQNLQKGYCLNLLFVMASYVLCSSLLYISCWICDCTTMTYGASLYGS